MLTPQKKSCYIFPYSLPTDSILRELYIKDALLDIEGLIKLFETFKIDDRQILVRHSQLSVRLSSEGKLDTFFYKADHYQEEVNIDAFKKLALKVIRKGSMSLLQKVRERRENRII